MINSIFYDMIRYDPAPPHPNFSLKMKMGVWGPPEAIGDNEEG